MSSVRAVNHHPPVPQVTDVHDAAEKLAEAWDKLEEAQQDLEAVGGGLYHIAPPALVVSGLSKQEQKGGVGADVD